MTHCVDGLRFKIVCTSLGRAGKLAQHPLLPLLTLVVPASEERAYQRAVGGRVAGLYAHPDLDGLARTRNFVLDEVYAGDEDFVFLVDDDVYRIRHMMRFRVVYLTRHDHILAVIGRTARLALEAGTNLFGYAPTPRPQERKGWEPFSLRVWIDGQSMGVIGREQRFDDRLRSGSDIDFSLQTLRDRRILLRDNRYAWEQRRWSVGGASHFRTTAEFGRNLAHLQRKWGRGVIQPNPSKRRTGLAVRVQVN